jgi:carboxyl-terminal processing protease
MLIFIAFASLALQQQPQLPSVWASSSAPPGAYAVDSAGSVTAGTARMSLRASAATTQSNGTVMISLAADTLRMRRVTVTSEVRGHGSTTFTVRGSNYTTRAFSSIGGPLATADTQWTSRNLQLIVSRTAARVEIVATIRGEGDIEVRNVKMTVADLPPANTPLATDAKRELDSALMIVRQASFWRDTVTWTELETDVRTLAAGSQTPAETYPAIRELLTRLGDHHSFLMPAQQSAQWESGTIAKNPLPVVNALDGAAGIGYVSVAAYSGGDVKGTQEYASGTHALLATVAPAATCGWILDLRQNGGGNMWPMLAGLKPFVGTVSLGSFSGPTGGGQSWIAGAGVRVDPPASLSPLDSSAVAVLIGPRTASSGEAVGVAFHGRPHTRFFGQPTAGLANANGTMKLPDGAMMMVMTAVDVDRNGQRFGEKITPDETIAQSSIANPVTATDPTVAVAVRWLTAQPRCRVR